ncbi:MAG TPA: helix-turn-helix domain-containing protein [Candidatus Acidoferrales bacterium]|jgi:cytoskeletal protein RodZ|nr:helix-turn-helix domain-containing protein [Candidatus Acidoferrales bacterium]
MTKDTFGGSLKREREMRGVTLEEIAAATRIATRFLRAIEEEQWDQLPGGVFNRGFVRAVARYLGLDEEHTVAEYILAIGDRPSVPVWTGSPPIVAPQQPWLAWVMVVIVILALLAGTWFGTRRFLAWRAAKRTAQTAAVSHASSSAAEQTTTQPVSPNDINNDKPAQDGPDTTMGTPAADSASATAPILPSTQRFELKVASRKKTKVIVMADQDMVFDGTIKAGENHFFSASDHFQVSAKDVGVLHLELNGKTLAAFGLPGHPGKITLTRDNLRGAVGGTN